MIGTWRSLLKEITTTRQHPKRLADTIQRLNECTVGREGEILINQSTMHITKMMMTMIMPLDLMRLMVTQELLQIEHEDQVRIWILNIMLGRHVVVSSHTFEWTSCRILFREAIAVVVEDETRQSKHATNTSPGDYEWCCNQWNDDQG